MFKQAFVRGVQTALLQDGRVAFPDQDAALKVADYVAERIEFEPQEKVSRDTTVKIANALIESSDWFKKNGYKAAGFNKLATVDDVNSVAHAHVINLMEKAAEGSTIEGGDKGNKDYNSGEGDLDKERKNEDYARQDQGGQSALQSMITDKAIVGQELDIRSEHGRPATGENSATEHSDKAASLADLMKKVAEGSTIEGGDKGNKTNSNAEGDLDKERKNPGYARLAPGQESAIQALINEKAVVGREIDIRSDRARPAPGDNSLYDHTEKASADAAFVTLFKKTAAEVHAYIPTSLDEQVRVAHVRACMGMTTAEKAHYLKGLQKEAADKTAASNAHFSGKHAELPDFIKEKMEAKKDGDGDGKKDEDDKKNPFATKDDKDGDGDKKEASLADHLRRISASIKA